jgi:AraC-like DNA-binding protein
MNNPQPGRKPATNKPNPAIPGSAAQWLIKVLVEDGIALKRLLQGTRLENDWCTQPEATLSAADYEQLLRNALAASNDPALGLSVSRQSNYLSRYGFWGYAVMSCTTLGDALETSMRFWPLTGALINLQLQPCESERWLEVTPAFDFVRDDIWRFGVEKFLSSSHLSVAWMVDKGRPVRALELDYPEPLHAERYRQLLGCPVCFGCPQTRVLLDIAALQLPLATSQPQLADMCRERCAQALLSMRGEDRLLASVQEIVWSNVSRPPPLEAVAEQLGLASRTLRRRLQERGSSYQQILDSVREAVARDYLVNTELSIEQIAALVGFSEATTFRSTFKRWTGQSAADIRRARKQVTPASAQKPSQTPR